MSDSGQHLGSGDVSASEALLVERLGAAAVERLRDLERRVVGQAPPLPWSGRAPPRGTALDCDVLLAGGGLSLLYAVTLARAGVRVAVADPNGVARGHREWNASMPELQALVSGGILDERELQELVAARYARGLVRWRGSAPVYTRGVLDVAIDAQRLLDHLRARCGALGVTLLDGAGVIGQSVGEGGVEVALRDRDGAVRTHICRLLLDGRGASSPFARWDLVCPTVGGVLGGLALGEGPDEVDPSVGELLVSVDDAQDGRLPIWEGFPGRSGEFTTYLFEYTEPQRLGPRPLTALYGRFFSSLHRYKRGDATVLRPTFGFIPAHSRLRPHPASPSDRVLLVGDAAARHSPLTFCGFGAALRSFAPVCARLLERLGADRLDRRGLEACWAEAPSLTVLGALALMMTDRSLARRDPAWTNRLLGAAFDALAAQGDEAFRDVLQDRAGPGQIWRLLRATARREPRVYRAVMETLSLRELLSFARNFAAFGLRGAEVTWPT